MDITKHTSTLPTKLEDLTKFVLVGREKLSAVRSLIRAMDKMEVAAEVRTQKIEEAQMLAEALLDAEARIGELTMKIPKASGGDRKSNKIKMDSGVHFDKTKEQKIKELGFEWKQVQRFEALAENKDIIEQAKAEARANDDIVNRTMVLKAIKDESKQQRHEERKTAYDIASQTFKNEDIHIFMEDFQKGCDRLENNSVDAIITDPPYPIEYIDLWQEMFTMAERVLKPSAFLVAYANHQNLDRIFQLNNPLKYYWIFKLDFTAKPIAMGRNLIATWKPVLVYQKLPFKKIEQTIEDVIKETKVFKYEERDMHDLNWGQSLGKFEYIIEAFTKPNDLVLEPFAGTGTTLVACKNTKRRCIGFENDPQYEAIIKGRIMEGR